MEFLRYVAVQVLAYGVDMGGFLYLQTLGLSALTANGLGKVAAGIFAFLVHKGFTFRTPQSESTGKQAIKYAALLALNIPLSSLVLSVMMTFVPHVSGAKFASDVLCVLITYSLTRLFVFGSAKSTKAVHTADAGGAP